MTTPDLGEVGQGQAKLPAWVEMMLHFRKAANMTLGNCIVCLVTLFEETDNQNKYSSMTVPSGLWKVT